MTKVKTVRYGCVVTVTVTIDSGSLQADRVRYIQVTRQFLGSCSVTVVHRVTAIYRVVIYRFDCIT